MDVESTGLLSNDDLENIIELERLLKQEEIVELEYSTESNESLEAETLEDNESDCSLESTEESDCVGFSEDSEKNKLSFEYREYKKEYRCKDCEESFTRQIYLERHSRTHKSYFKCYLCNEFYGSNKNFLKHQYKCHWEQYMCFFCTLTFFSTDALEDHVKREHPNLKIPGSENLKCFLCNQVMYPKSYLSKHIQRIHKVKCGECYESFSLRSLLIQHFFEKHFPENVEHTCDIVNSKCKVCELQFHSKSNISRNDQSGLNVSEQCKCLKCGEVFATRMDLQTHSELNHSTFQCEICSKILRSRSDLNHHLKYLHHKNIPIDQCANAHNSFRNTEPRKRSQSTSRDYILKSHFEAHYPGVDLGFLFKCNVCDETFKTKPEASEHSKIAHEAVSPSPSYEGYDLDVLDLLALQNNQPCDPEVLDYIGFDKNDNGNEADEEDPSSKEALSNSVNANCNVCGQLFATNDSLRRHFRIMHPGETLHLDSTCKKCDLVFGTIYDFKQHSVLVHGCVVDDRTPERNQQPASSKPKHKKKKKSINARCSECHYVFTTKFNLRRHFDKLHPGLTLVPEYKCKYCDSFFKTQEQVRVHWLLHHLPESSVTNHLYQSYDSMSPTDSQDLIKKESDDITESSSEMGVSHSNPDCPNSEPDRQGSESLISYGSNSELEANNISSSNPEGSNSLQSNSEPEASSSTKRVPRITFKRKFINAINAKCHVCESLYSTNYNLRRHYHKMHPGVQMKSIEFKCKNCDEFFETMGEVRKHSKMVHKQADKPKPVYGRCSICKLLSTTRSNLKRHFEMKHPGREFDIEYKCGECEDYFRDVEDFIHHSRTAHNDLEQFVRNTSLIPIEDEISGDCNMAFEHGFESESSNVISFSVFEIEDDLDIKVEMEDS